jgi:hypothetical protein
VSRRFNKYGFSLAQMRRLFGSRDEVALQQLHTEIAARDHYRSATDQNAIIEVVDRAVMSGVPFPELQTESWVHAVAAERLSRHGQEWLYNYSSVLEDAFALEEGLWGNYRKLATPETRAFLRGLVEGIPMFGCQARESLAYGAVSLEKLRVFQPGLRDLAELIAYRVGRKKSATELDRAVVEFTAELRDFVDEIIAAERDLFFSFG